MDNVPSKHSKKRTNRKPKKRKIQLQEQALRSKIEQSSDAVKETTSCEQAENLQENFDEIPSPFTFMMPNDDTRTIYGSGNDNWENINTEAELFHEIDDIVKNCGVEVLYQREPGTDIINSLKENTNGSIASSKKSKHINQDGDNTKFATNKRILELTAENGDTAFPSVEETEVIDSLATSTEVEHGSGKRCWEEIEDDDDGDLPSMETSKSTNCSPDTHSTTSRIVRKNGRTKRKIKLKNNVENGKTGTETKPQLANGRNVTEDASEDLMSDSDEWADHSDGEGHHPDVSSEAGHNQFEEINQNISDEENQEETKTLFDTDVLPVELYLSEQYLSQFPDYKYTDYIEEKDDKLSLCTTEPNRFKRCLLEIENSHLATCTTLDSTDIIREITIYGRSKCGACFSDDEVIVEILADTPKKAKSKKSSKTNYTDNVNDNTIYGKVISVIKRNRHQNVRHPVFLCTVDETEGHLMKPLCKTVPKIHVLNLNILKNHQANRRHKVEIYTHNFDRGELTLEKYFDIEPAHRNKYIFVVSYLFWKPRSMYPRGAVIKVLHTEDDIAAGLKVVALQNNVPRFYTQSTITAVEDLIESFKDKELIVEDDREDLTDSISVFTIDPPNAQNLDDGLSVETIDQGLFRTGVHIADVSMFVQKDDSIDKEAYSRATTYYPGQGFNPHHMIPQSLSKQMCSLLPNKRRLALSVFFKMTVDGVIVGKPEIKKTVIKSCKQFSYTDVQDIILGKTTSNTNTKLDDDIKVLYRMTLGLRKSRLKDAMFALPVESFVDDHNSILNSLQAHWLVEEMMVLTNVIVAEYIIDFFPNSTILRCQDRPPDETLEKWLKSYPVIAHSILHLQNATEKTSLQHLPKMRYTSLIPLQKWVWERLVKNIETNNMPAAVQLLAKDELHPEQALAYEEWISFQETAEYRPSNTTNAEHFSLRQRIYIQFTSPLRRFPDLISHRLLHAALDGRTSPYSEEEIECICDQINVKFNFAKRYQKNIRMLTLAHKLKNDPQILHGFVQNVCDQNILLHFPGLRCISKSQRQIHFNSLNVVSTPVIEVETNAYRKKETEKLKCAKVKMQKRLYRYTGFPKRLNENNTGSNIIDPNQRSVVLKFEDFLSLIQNLFEPNPNIKEDIEQIKLNHVMCKSYLYPQVKHQIDVTSEVSKGLIIKHHCEFEFSFHIAQVVAVQMSAEMRFGLLVPKPQMLIMTNDVKCCLMHIEDPVKTLATKSVKFTSSTYQSLTEYIDTWIPLMEMESAKHAATNGDSVTVNGISIKFSGRDGKFSHKKSFFAHRDIEFSVPFAILKRREQNCPDEDEDNSQEAEERGYVQLSSSDFLCITIPQNPSSALEEERLWIGHASITKLRKREKPIIRNVNEKSEKGSVKMVDVVFKLHPDAPKPPDCANKNQKTCCIEILRKLPFQRRTESLVKMLKDATPLAQAIALGTEIPKLDQETHDIAKKIGTDVDVTDPAGYRCMVKNNSKQSKAIYKALTSSFSLIQGPPGTGKTYTGIKLVYLFTEINKQLSNGTGKRQIVYCGPSNKSVDLVARWMKYKLGDQAPKMIRMYGSSYETLDFPVPGKASIQTRRRQKHEIDKDLLHFGAVLHFVIREKDKPFADQLRTFDEKFKKIFRESRKQDKPFADQLRTFDEKFKKIFRESRKQNQKEQTEKNNDDDMLNLKDIKQYLKILNEAKAEELKCYDVIFCTTSVVVNPNFLRMVSGRINQCIIDESGMCTEPETLAPIIATAAKQVVLIGDHKQLRPVITCREAADLGLEKSLFERYANIEKHLTMLVCQYRMNPHICYFPSQEFYKGRLTTEKSRSWEDNSPFQFWKISERKIADPLRRHLPHLFCHIEGEEDSLLVSTEDGNEQSKSNMAEVEHMVTIYRYLTTIEGVKPWNINVISQYNAQCNKLRKAFAEKKLERVIVNTVSSSQGGEWDYVLFSTVRSLPKILIEPQPSIGWCKQNLGFIMDENQINVALTRARKGIIIVGNQHLLRCNGVWRELLDYYSRCRCVVHAGIFPPSVCSSVSAEKFKQAKKMQKKMK